MKFCTASGLDNIPVATSAPPCIIRFDFSKKPEKFVISVFVIPVAVAAIVAPPGTS